MWRSRGRNPIAPFHIRLDACGGVARTHESPNGLHSQTCADSSDQPAALALTESHLLYRVTDT